MRALVCLPLLFAACSDAPKPAGPPPAPRDARLDPALQALASDDLRTRLEACLELGAIGGDEARDTLVGILRAPSPEPQRDGPMRLYAAVGLTRLKDPATAMTLVESLSRVNPNDNIAALSSEEVEGEYYTVDAQLCEALLMLGIWGAEEELCNQLKRKDKIRVFVDAHAILRRHTGLDIPYEYNASYADRERQAEAWRAQLRATRAEREKARPFDGSSEIFKEECRRVVAWLGGWRVNDRLIAYKALVIIGRYAVPFLEEGLASDNRVMRRQAVHMLGRIGHPDGTPALRKALDLEDADARAEAVDGLWKVNDADSVPRVVQLLGDADAEVRAASARYLGRQGGDAGKAALRARLESESRPAVKAWIWMALLRLGEKDALDPVLRAFVESEQVERIAAKEVVELSQGRPLDATGLDEKAERERAVAAYRAR
ncbi:MAG: HEAT repeat domain-containing protein [Planctomycetota bacterium]